MFEFITISNGEVAIRHREEGHVFRFRPASYGEWSHLRLSRIEQGEGSTSAADSHLKAAYAFAAQTVADLDLVGA